MKGGVNMFIYKENFDEELAREQEIMELKNEVEYLAEYAETSFLYDSFEEYEKCKLMEEFA